MTGTSKEAVERLAHTIELGSIGPKDTLARTAATLRQLLTERDAEKARADKAESAAGKWAAMGGLANKIAELRIELTAANEKLASAREVVEFVAQSRDAGRHDGKPEECPAHDDVVMWLRAKDFLATHPATPASHGGQS